MNNQESIRKSFKTILEMLQDRGLDISNINETLLHDTMAINGHKTGFLIEFKDIKLIYYLSTKFKWSELKKLFENLTNTDSTLYILIIADKISQNNMKSIAELNLNMQIFNIKELQFNITKHELVPKHEVIHDQEEIKRILDGYCLKNKFQLPIIMKSDPMSRYLGLKNGDIIKIVRNSPTSGEYTVFRCCM